MEGAGGLLVELGDDGVTLRDVAVDLGAPVLVVVAAGLGTLNHTALTLEALAAQGIPCAGLVIGSWPADPGLAEEGNREALAELAPLRAVLPAGAGVLDSAAFETTERVRFRFRTGSRVWFSDGPFRRVGLRPGHRGGGPAHLG